MGPQVGGMLAVLARTGVCAFIMCPCRSGPQQSVPSAYHSVPQQLSLAWLARFCPVGLKSKSSVFELLFS